MGINPSRGEILQRRAVVVQAVCKTATEKVVVARRFRLLHSGHVDKQIKVLLLLLLASGKRQSQQIPHVLHTLPPQTADTLAPPLRTAIIIIGIVRAVGVAIDGTLILTDRSVILAASTRLVERR